MQKGKKATVTRAKPNEAKAKRIAEKESSNSSSNSEESDQRNAAQQQQQRAAQFN